MAVRSYEERRPFPDLSKHLDRTRYQAWNIFQNKYQPTSPEGRAARDFGAGYAALYLGAIRLPGMLWRTLTQHKTFKEIVKEESPIVWHQAQAKGMVFIGDAGALLTAGFALPMAIHYPEHAQMFADRAMGLLSQAVAVIPSVLR